MKDNSFEKLNNGILKKIVIGSTCFVTILSVGILVTSRAKYKLTESINIANGTVNYKVPDINIVALYIKDEEEYIESSNIPESGYTLNTEKSVCKIYDGSTTLEEAPKDTGITIEYSNGKVNFLGISKRNTRCYLYFDKYVEPPLSIPNIIAANNPKDETPTFSRAATTDEGVYKVSDGMYGGDSYYFRGAVTNNYVKFANFCWRIIRINGDGTMRLIYDGEYCHANGTSATESIAVTGQAYNTSYDRSEYVGYTYAQGRHRGTTTASKLKTQTESWYKKNITNKGFDEQVAPGKFCNDRDIASGYSWASQPASTFYYATQERLQTDKTPTLDCSNSGDVHSLKVGAITADEVAFSGGVYGTSNSSYYLYNGQNYWTMSPYHYFYNSTSGKGVYVFRVSSGGQLHYDGVHFNNGVRPVINLRSDTQIKAGTDGTLNNPYEVI